MRLSRLAAMVCGADTRSRLLPGPSAANGPPLKGWGWHSLTRTSPPPHGDSLLCSARRDREVRGLAFQEQICNYTNPQPYRG